MEAVHRCTTQSGLIQHYIIAVQLYWYEAESGMCDVTITHYTEMSVRQRTHTFFVDTSLCNSLKPLERYT